MARFHGVLRAVVIGSVLLVAWPAAAAPPSNPAFLGVSMVDVPNGCMVDGVTPGSGAEAIGLTSGDRVVMVEDASIRTCDELTAQIIEHAPGDRVRLLIDRGGRDLTFRALLSSRAEVLQRRYVGAPVPDFPVTDYDDGQPIDLSRLVGDTNVLAWFDARHCESCAQVVERIANKTHVTGVTWGEAKELAGGHLATRLGFKLALFENDKQFDRASMNEHDRIYFMVVDCHGIVRFVLPVVPDADDADAAVDEVLAAVEQADHARARR